MRLLTLALAAVLATSAQSQQAEWGKSFTQFEDILDYLGEIGDTQYFLANKENKHYVQSVSTDLTAAEPVELPRASDDGRLDFESVVVMKDRIYLFNSLNDRPNKTLYLFVEELDPVSLEPAGASTNIGLIKYGFINDTGEFAFALSEDRTRLAIRYDTPDKDKEEETFTVQLFDQYMTMKWEEICTVSTIHDFFVWEDFEVSNSGVVYLGNTRYDRRPGTGKKGEVIMHPFVSILSGNGNGLSDVEMNFTGLLVNDLMITADDEGTAYVVGSSSLTDEKSGNGLVFGRISQTEVKLTSVDLSNEVIFKSLSESSEISARKALAKKGLRPDIRGLRIRDVQMKANGSIVAALESVRKSNEPVAGGQFAQQSNLERSYFMRDAVIAEFSPEGELNYTNLVPKRQHSTGEDNMFASFEMVVVGNQTYVIYNDHQSNIDKDRSGDMHNLQNHMKCKPTMAVIDAEGNVKRQYLILDGEDDFIIRPAASGQIGRRSEMVLYARERSSRMFGKLKF